jgi:hypothetical protein
VGQAEATPDQTAARKNRLDFFRSRAGGDVEILGRLAQQKIAHAAADDERLETCFLQGANDVGGMRTKLLEPDPVLGLGNGNERFDDDLRFVTG